MKMFDARDHRHIEHKNDDRSRRNDRPAQQSKLGLLRPSHHLPKRSLLARREVVSGLAELSGRKTIRYRQRTALVGFQGNLLGQHDVARDEMIVRHEAPARSRLASVVQLVDVRSHGVAYPVPLSGVAACDLEIVVRVVLRQLLGRQPFPQELTAANLDCTWALIPIAKGSRPA